MKTKEKTIKQIKEEILEALEEPKPLSNLVGGFISILFATSMLSKSIGIATKSLKKEGILK